MNADPEYALPEILDAGVFELRRASPEYVDQVLEAVEESLHELRPWMGWAQKMPASEGMSTVLSEADKSFRAEGDWMYLLIDRSSAKVVGSSGLHRRIGPHGLEIGYWVRTSFTGRGYATQTAKTLTDVAFSYLDWVERVEIRMDRANVASAAVPRKLGFTLVREEERPRVTPGHTGVGLIWSVDRSAWESRKLNDATG
jgi:RimJ/RimL family protein N-acetyltransferase